MAEVSQKPYLSVQCDWNYDMKQKSKGSFWVSASKEGQTSHGSIQVNFSNGSHKLEGEDGFNVDKYDESNLHRWIELSYSGTKARFNSPVYQVKHHSSQVNTLDVSPHGELVISGADNGSLILWDASNGSLLREMKGHVGDVLTSKFFPSGQVVLSGGSDTLIKVWAIDGDCAATMKGHAGGVLDTSIVERGRNIISCSRDGTVKLWEVGSQTVIQTLINGTSAVNCCFLGKSGPLNPTPSNRELDSREVGTEDKFLVVGCENGKLVAADLRSQKEIFSTSFSSSAINALSVSEDYKLLAGDEDGVLSLWDLRNYSNPLQLSKRSSSAIRSIAKGFKSETFWVGGADGSCYEWNATSSTSGSELTGSDCEPIQAIYCRGNEIFVG